MKLKKAVEEYTEHEFRLLIQSIKDCNGTEEEHSELVAHLNSLVAAAGGSDLIYYPEPGADTSAEGITRAVKEWREANGLPSFKPQF